MVNLQNLEQSTYEVLLKYFKVLGRRGWVKQVSVYRILVLLFAVRFWWRYSTIMAEEDIDALQKLFDCLGIDCLIPSMKSDLQDKVVININSAISQFHTLADEHETMYLIAEKSSLILTPEDSQTT